MRLGLVLLILLLFNPKLISAQVAFPDKCIGQWEGMMHIFQKGILKDSVKIKFSVSPASNNQWNWKTEYISEKFPLTKDYQLKLDEKNNRYMVDEGAGVVLYDYLFGDKLYGVFETHNIMLTSTYELTKDGELIFEVTSGKRIEGKAEDEVRNFTVESVQRVIMRRMNPISNKTKHS